MASLLHSLAGSRFVARAVGREAVVAVGDDRGHRQRLRPLLLQRRDLLVQRLLLRQVLRATSRGRSRRSKPRWCESPAPPAGPLPASASLPESAIARCTLAGYFLYFSCASLRAIRLLDLSNPLPQRRDLRIDFSRLLLVRLGLLFRRQRIIRLHVPEQRGLHLVVVFLRDRIELVVVAARAIAP